MDIVLAGAGVFVTLLVVAAMVLIVPRGTEHAEGSASNQAPTPDAEEAPVPVPVPVANA